jgi:hypothetical protein
MIRVTQNMTERLIRLGICIAVLLSAVQMTRGADPGAEGTRRAVAFLVQEVPAWPQQNKCFSCHNNGDGFRALTVARGRGWNVPEEALSTTREWLLHPERWETSGGNPDYGDRQLINVQFSAALAEFSAGGNSHAEAELSERAEDVLETIAPKIVELQSPDGSWAFEAEGSIGSPIGYGRPLMTFIAQTVLLHAGQTKYADPIERAGDWLRQAEPKGVLDSAAVVWGLAKEEDREAVASVTRRLETIRQGQSKRGGWGPYVTSPPEPFDTAIVLLGLSALPPTKETQKMIAAGRQYLFDTQLPSGGWPATTRPAGLESYPQMISTCAWATLALVMTEPPLTE